MNIGVVPGAALFLLSWTMLIWLGYKFLSAKERKKWNGGVCSKCGEGHYKPFAVDSTRAHGCQCDKCGHEIWISGRVMTYADSTS